MQVFNLAVEIDGKRFEGSARNKKLAKSRCAQAALSKLFGMDFTKKKGNWKMKLAKNRCAQAALSKLFGME